MDLKNKFDNYQTEVDAEAWAHFQLLRNNQRPKRRFFWWFFFGGLLLVGLIGISLWAFNKQTIDTSENLSSQVIDNTPIINHKEQKEITTIDENKIIPSKQEDLTTTINKVIKNTNTSTNNERNINKTTSNSTFTKNSSTQKELETQNTLQNIDNGSNHLLLEEDKLTSNGIENELVKTKTEKERKYQKTYTLVNIESPINKLLLIPDSTEALNLLSLPSLIKPIQSKKNTLKFGIGLADAYVNGFSLENPVNKKGPALQLEYYHEWNKIIGTGVSAGYIDMVDRKNPSVAIKDRETIKFLHANLYLFLLNENKHRLYAKVGAGLTNTDRVLGTFLVKINGEVERTFQINNITDIGFVVEGAYEYKLNKSFIIGANYSIISHNDGGWYTGLSIGYQF